MIWQTVSTSSAETESIGSLIGASLKGGEVIELRSDLGGGKTTFVRGLAAGAGSKANVTSPTFTLSRLYPAKNFSIHHFDFYRLNDP
ncbi:tRNA (adenosine(37)-N6)-threonylcarbamoyltransferase complex ATPase subunit type 1 TsaE, partial [Candidatus Saccharibacteria bacterium]|nr:tRNA (adenosine(37)-N6)-threonylcarbamoyltransferase complex ATPase subunit type 1 TsaE [Candidatus Saccharibacteria bacterium]